MPKLEFAKKQNIIQDDLWSLPFELTLQILLRLPLKSLAKLKLLSKTWYFLISSPNSTNFLIRFSTFIKPHTLIFQSKNCISSLKFDDSSTIYDDDMNNLGLNTTLLDHPFPETPTGVHYYCAGSYNGVVCIHITTPELEEHIILWNPLTRECRSIPLPPTRVDDPPISLIWCRYKSYWFGFVDLLSDVIIFHLKRNRSYMYSMKKDSWKEFTHSDRFNIESDSIPCRSLGTRFVLKDGVLYYALGFHSILKFDLVDETFSRVRHLNQHCTNFVNKYVYRMVDVALGVTKENNLCSCRVFENNRRNDRWVLEVWNLIQGSKNSSSWKKLHKIYLAKETPRPYPWVIGFTYQGKIFVGGEKLLIVDPNRVPSDNVQQVKTKHTSMYTLSFVETLLSPYLLHNFD